MEINVQTAQTADSGLLPFGCKRRVLPTALEEHALWHYLTTCDIGALAQVSRNTKSAVIRILKESHCLNILNCRPRDAVVEANYPKRRDGRIGIRLAMKHCRNLKYLRDLERSQTGVCLMRCIALSNCSTLTTLAGPRISEDGLCLLTDWEEWYPRLQSLEIALLRSESSVMSALNRLRDRQQLKSSELLSLRATLNDAQATLECLKLPALARLTSLSLDLAFPPEAAFYKRLNTSLSKLRDLTDLSLRVHLKQAVGKSEAGVCKIELPSLQRLTVDLDLGAPDETLSLPLQLEQRFAFACGGVACVNWPSTVKLASERCRAATMPRPARVEVHETVTVGLR